MEETDIVKTPLSPPEPQPEEPEAKKLKMSTTTTSDEDTIDANSTADAKTPRTNRYKRRKIAIFFAYCGVGYQGMQKNPGAKTIESDLEEALFLSGAVPEQDRGNSRRYDWARSARTDKGVSAVGQVVSGRFYIDPPGFVERLNSNLSSQIRIFGYKRATASFNAKKFCDRRRYVYLIPVFALDPSSHRDRESVLASLGSGNVLVKCVECSERGRKIPEAMLKRICEKKVGEIESGISSDNGDTEMNSKVTENTMLCDNTSSEQGAKGLVDDGISHSVTESKQNEETALNSTIVNDSGVDKEEEKVNREEEAEKRSSFCYGEEERERFNRILKYYVGSHNFHNFTTRTKAEDPAARRYILSFDANSPVTVEGIEFVKCEVVGQSFMLHQIRKMIGLAVAIMRNCAPESLISTALQRDVNVTVPTAPEVGLFLDECFFTSYNQKWKDSHEELSMKEFEEEAENFKMKQIYSHIASTEDKEGVVALWLHSLNHRNYPDLCGRVVDNATSNGEKSVTVENIAE
ncbi:tRNA pseudouridine synthase A mitochondrial-like [Tripterygium wilfordii]|uniref:tRNA pseudouridine synthase A mitochondrial-like n=1 Tax=Tripterygium wilfordii TaxID=458696 RepID=A0A7J7DLL2_TRIWF|nr:tRNA pseudouridine synthase A-like [Tripterygium wilfordii]KAF5747208.1 tRNA pseudouridine synthase A mitochondrial-like [Tripterygium wilfordii]